MTHAGAFHNPLIGGVWALHQSPSFATTGAVATDLRDAFELSEAVVGFCWRVPWNSIESNTSPGTWLASGNTSLNAAYSICQEYGRKFAIRPITGQYTPLYVYNTLGVNCFTASSQSTTRINPLVNPVSAGTCAPHPCTSAGAPSTAFIDRFAAFMGQLRDWALARGINNVPYVHGSHFSRNYSEFYHGPPVQGGQTGYGGAGSTANFDAAHEALWSAVWDVMDGSGVATEFGMSGQHVEDIQINAVEFLHSLGGDYNPYLVVNANGTAGNVSGGTDWGATSETQQDTQCGFAVNGVYNPPAARRNTKMNQAIDPGNFSASYWHNVFLTLRSSKTEGVELYLADGSQAPNGVPGKGFSGSNSGFLADEAETWMAEQVGGGPQTQATIASVLPKYTQVMAGFRWTNATISSILPAFTQVMAGMHDTTGSILSELPMFDQAMTAATDPGSDNAVIANALPKFTQAATAERGENLLTMASTLPSLTQSMLAHRWVLGAIAQTMPMFTQQMVVMRAGQADGQAIISQALPSFDQDMEVDADVDPGTCVINSKLGSFTQEMEAGPEPQLSISSVMPAFRNDMRVTNRRRRHFHPIFAIPTRDGTGLILPQKPLARPDNISIGLFDRDSSPDNSNQPGWGGLTVAGNYVKGYVLNVNWSDLQPDGLDQDFQSTLIEDTIDEAAGLGLQLKVRLFMGRFAPEWVKTIGTGPITLTLPQPPNTVATVPIWWHDDFLTAADALWVQFIERYNPFCQPDGPLYEVVVADCMTFFAEPDLHQTGQESIYHNREFGYAPHGYTLADDLAAQRLSFDRRLDLRCVSSRACNPYQVCDSPANSTAHTINLINYGRQTLGYYASFGNNSLRVAPGFPTAKYQEIYTAIQAKGAPSYFQTAATSRVGNLFGACQSAVSYGATMVELPGSTFAYTNTTEPTGMSPDQFDEINAGLAANAALKGWT